MHCLLSITLSLIACLPLAAQESPTCAKPVKVWAIYDADTITGCEIQMGWGHKFEPPKGMRAADFDAFEVDERRSTVHVTEVEKVRGRQATEDFRKLLESGTLYVEEVNWSGGHDRIAAKWWILPRGGTEFIRVAYWMRDRFHIREPLEVTRAKYER